MQCKTVIYYNHFYIEVICHIHVKNSLQIIIAELDGRFRVSGLPLNDQHVCFESHIPVSLCRCPTLMAGW